MTRLTLHRDVGFPRRHVYDIVADVRRYPEFLPGFQGVRVKGEQNGKLMVYQSLGFKGLRRAFHTYASFDPPEVIRITTNEAPFRHLDQVWRFDSLGERMTRVTLDAEYEFADRLAKGFAERIFPHLMRQSMDAFVRRAARVTPSRSNAPAQQQKDP